jgi:hypothetical protein
MAFSNILVWNTHGLNDRVRSDNVRLVIDTCRPSIVCIQETKLAEISSRDVRTLLGSDYSSFTYLAARGQGEEFWLHGQMVDFSRHTTVFIDIQCLYTSVWRVSRPGGLLAYMDPILMPKTSLLGGIKRSTWAVSRAMVSSRRFQHDILLRR